MKNHYEILGVDENATTDEIKKAYREMIKKYHPDKHPHVSEEDDTYYQEKTKEINEAFETLSNPAKRAIYDQQIANNKYYSSYDSYDYDNTYQRCESSEDESFTSHATYRKNSRRHTKKSTVKKVVDAFTKAYKEVKEDEEKEPFTKRHRDINQRFKKIYKQGNNSVPEIILLHICNGTVHIGKEVLYQIKKVKYINKDDALKFAIRNRVTAGAMAVIIGAINIGGVLFPSEEKTDNQTIIVAGKSENTKSEDEEKTIRLNRIYTVEAGDSLSYISDMSNTPIETIKRVNQIDSSMLYIGSKVEIPYDIDSKDLRYYIDEVPSYNLSIQDLAEKYETDEETIEKLNSEAITRIDDVKVILSDNVIVPNFITVDELREKRQNKEKTNIYQ